MNIWKPNGFLKMTSLKTLFCRCHSISLVLFCVLWISPLPFFSTRGHGRSQGFAEAGSKPSISTALSVLKKVDARYFVAGGTCAAISHGITTPIDVVKTKIQSDPVKYNKGMIRTAIDLCQSEGPGVLAAGLGPTVVGYGVEGAMKFGVYEVAKSVLLELFGSDHKAVAFIVASLVAGSVAALLLCPMESARIKMVTDPSYDGLNFPKAVRKMIADEGMFASFGGIYAMLSKQVPYTFGKQVSFDVFATNLYAIFSAIPNRLSDTAIKWIVSFLSAFCASLVACLFSQPGDMILTETFHKTQSRPSPASFTPSELFLPTATHQDHPVELDTYALDPTSTLVTEMDELEPTLYDSDIGTTQSDLAFLQTMEKQSFQDVVLAIYKNGGILAFFTGTGARIVHVGLIITSQLVVYDIIKQLLGLPATGSH